MKKYSVTKIYKEVDLYEDKHINDLMWVSENTIHGSHRRMDTYKHDRVIWIFNFENEADAVAFKLERT